MNHRATMMNSNTPYSQQNNQQNNQHNNNNGSQGGCNSPVGGQRGGLSSYIGEPPDGQGGFSGDDERDVDDEVAYCSSYVDSKVPGTINPSTAQRSGAYANLPALIPVNATYTSSGGTSAGGSNVGSSSGG